LLREHALPRSVNTDVIFTSNEVLLPGEHSGNNVLTSYFRCLHCAPFEKHRVFSVMYTKFYQHFKLLYITYIATDYHN
jgi:hypothetical protein